MRLLKQSSTAQPLMFLLIQAADHITGLTGVSPTVTLSKSGAAFGAASGAVTELANGWYKVAGNATDTATLGPLILHATATGSDPTDVEYAVVAYDPQDPVRAGLTALPNAAAGANGGFPVLSSSATTLAYTISTLTTYTGNTPQTGDSYAVVNSGTFGNSAVKTLVDAIKAKTDNLPSDPADASDIASSFSTVNTTLSTISAAIAALPSTGSSATLANQTKIIEMVREIQ